MSDTNPEKPPANGPKSSEEYSLWSPPTHTSLEDSPMGGSPAFNIRVETLPDPVARQRALASTAYMEATPDSLALTMPPAFTSSHAETPPDSLRRPRVFSTAHPEVTPDQLSWPHAFSTADMQTTPSIHTNGPRLSETQMHNMKYLACQLSLLPGSSQGAEGGDPAMADIWGQPCTPLPGQPRTADETGRRPGIESIHTNGPRLSETQMHNMKYLACQLSLLPGSSQGAEGGDPAMADIWGQPCTPLPGQPRTADETGRRPGIESTAHPEVTPDQLSWPHAFSTADMQATPSIHTNGPRLSETQMHNMKYLACQLSLLPGSSQGAEGGDPAMADIWGQPCTPLPGQPRTADETGRRPGIESTAHPEVTPDQLSWPHAFSTADMQTTPSIHTNGPRLSETQMHNMKYLACQLSLLPGSSQGAEGGDPAMADIWGQPCTPLSGQPRTADETGRRPGIESTAHPEVTPDQLSWPHALSTADMQATPSIHTNGPRLSETQMHNMKYLACQLSLLPGSSQGAEGGDPAMADIWGQPCTPLSGQPRTADETGRRPGIDSTAHPEVTPDQLLWPHAFSTADMQATPSIHTNGPRLSETQMHNMKYLACQLFLLPGSSQGAEGGDPAMADIWGQPCTLLPGQPRTADETGRRPGIESTAHPEVTPDQLSWPHAFSTADMQATPSIHTNGPRLSETQMHNMKYLACQLSLLPGSSQGVEGGDPAMADIWGQPCTPLSGQPRTADETGRRPGIDSTAHPEVMPDQLSWPHAFSTADMQATPSIHTNGPRLSETQMHNMKYLACQLSLLPGSSQGVEGGDPAMADIWGQPCTPLSGQPRTADETGRRPGIDSTAHPEVTPDQLSWPHAFSTADMETTPSIHTNGPRLSETQMHNMKYLACQLSLLPGSSQGAEGGDPAMADIWGQPCTPLSGQPRTADETGRRPGIESTAHPEVTPDQLSWPHAFSTADMQATPSIHTNGPRLSETQMHNMKYLACQLCLLPGSSQGAEGGGSSYGRNLGTALYTTVRAATDSR
ncbi:hypothetical protein ACOMHN_011975 [Nucella lapillus]